MNLKVNTDRQYHCMDVTLIFEDTDFNLEYNLCIYRKNEMKTNALREIADKGNFAIESMLNISLLTRQEMLRCFWQFINDASRVDTSERPNYYLKHYTKNTLNKGVR